MSLFHSNNSLSVIIDSENRLSGSTSNFTINPSLPNYVSTFDRVVLSQISIPKSFYDININCNSLTYTENGVPINITIPIGMYNVNSLASILSSSLTSNSINSYTYTITYPNAYTSANTNKFTFTCSNTSVPISFIFSSNSLYQQMGFNNNSINTFSSGSITSTNSINISYINRLFLKSSCCNTSYNSILQELLVVGSYPSTSYVYWENLSNSDTYSKEFTQPNDNFFSFQLYDRYGNIVDLNGQNFVFSLHFYKKNHTDELHADSIKLDNLNKI
jgi:hypothetical protein